jgi:excisionase family DNA binding protein
MASKLLTTAQVASLLGIAPTTVHALTAAGDLPCVRTAGGHRRFCPEDVEAFLDRRQGRDGPDAVVRAGIWRKTALATLRAAERDLGPGAAAQPFREAARHLERMSVEEKREQ